MENRHYNSNRNVLEEGRRRGGVCVRVRSEEREE